MTKSLRFQKYIFHLFWATFSYFVALTYSFIVVFIWFQSMVKEKTNRLEELEEALKESVSITADREMVLAQQTQTINKLQKQVDLTLNTFNVT